MNDEGFTTDDEASGENALGNAEGNHPQALSEAINAIDVSNSLTAPLKRAIDLLLELAVRAVGSGEGSVLVRDGNEGGLKFLSAISRAKEELMKLHIPPGKGIAGLVFSSGEPMCVSDVSNEGSFWSEADKKTGFKTITLLATPLRTGGEMVGVLEFVNRPGAPPYQGFTPEEMDQAAYFADTIAGMVERHEIAHIVESLFDRSIKAIKASAEGRPDSTEDASQWVNSLALAREHRDMILMWLSLREILRQGDAERELCRDLLKTLARFAEKRSASSTAYSGF